MNEPINIPFDPDFDKSSVQKDAPVETSNVNTNSNLYINPRTAFGVGVAVALLVAGTLGFVFLLSVIY